VPGRDVEVWLRAGRHVVARANGTIDDVLRVPPGVALLGGFAGGEQVASQRDPRAHRTTLSADRAGDDGPGFSYRGDTVRGLVILGGLEPLRATLDGLVLSGSEGATALSADSSFEVRDCELSDNRAPLTAPIVDLRGRPFARLERCRFTANRGLVLRGTGAGGQGPLSIDGCLLHANVSDGAVVVLRRGGRVILAHATVAQNRVGSGRAALEIDAHHQGPTNETPQVWHSIIHGNVAGGAGGFGVQVALDGMNPENVLRRTLVEGFPLPTSVQGSFDANPMFEDPLGIDGAPGTGDEDLRLRVGSRAVDAGYEWLIPPSLTLDLDGHPRRTDDPLTSDSGLGAPPFADLGAYERLAGG
jgi:hypothetical protein